MMNDVDVDKLFSIEEWFRIIEEINFYNPVKLIDMCLVPNIVVPKKFKMLQFAKYTSM